MKVSFVIPVLNEEKNIPLIANRLEEVVAPITGDFEIIFVDDGSTDSSLIQVKLLHSKNPRIKGIGLSRNFGHQYALSAGLDFADGDAVILMDADLQHPPDLVPTLIAEWKKGAEIVHTKREETEGASFTKSFTSGVYYSIFEKLSGIKGAHGLADFRLLDKKVVKALRQIRERARYLRGLTLWIGFKSTVVPYTAPDRIHGVTKYNFRRMLKLASDGILSFSTLPLQFSIWIGAFVFVLGFLYGLYALSVKLFTNNGVPGWTSLVIIISMFSGFQMLLTGIQGLYLGKIFEEVKSRPIYLVRDTIGLHTNERANPY